MDISLQILIKIACISVLIACVPILVMLAWQLLGLTLDRLSHTSPIRKAADTAANIRSMARSRKMAAMDEYIRVLKADRDAIVREADKKAMEFKEKCRNCRESRAEKCREAAGCVN